MQVTNGAVSGVFGLYELASDGTILYSRPRSADTLSDGERQVVGRDFFQDVFPCQNVSDLRRHFKSFILDDRSVDTFLFDGLFEQEIVRAKIFMTRGYENDYDHAGGIVILEIREAD